MFIILYNHYFSKKIRIKKKSVKVKIQDLINYSTVNLLLNRSENIILNENITNLG
jgi:hypothetical protein